MFDCLWANSIWLAAQHTTSLERADGPFKPLFPRFPELGAIDEPTPLGGFLLGGGKGHISGIPPVENWR